MSRDSKKGRHGPGEPPGEQSQDYEGDYYVLDPQQSDPKRLKKEREKARKLKKSNWWLKQIQAGVCHYCGNKFPAAQLTMDHVVPLARGGSSTPGNIVPSCPNCNRDKKLHTPVEQILKQLKERK